MRHRWLAIAILIFEAFWLNVVVPGHQRGIVQLPGTKESCPDCCCCAKTNFPPTKQPDNSVPVGKASTCAICFFAAHLSTPPAIDLSLPALRFLHRFQQENSAEIVYQTCPIPFNSRGPPQSA